LLIGLGGWWGGEMVYVKGMAVETGDHTAQTKNRRADYAELNRPMFFFRHLKMLE
jgi:hypothetical protein